jgi:superfamily II DNA/RNA helicase
VAGLKESGFRAEALHGEMTLARRSKLVEAFQNSEFQILVSTDLLSRGIDIPNLPAVVNFDLPHNPEDYIHRIGRTGRAGAPGKAYSFISKDRSTVELGGYVVEIDESVFLSKISELLNKSLHVTKVPGPWRDQARERNKPVEGETQVTETEGAESREYYQTDVTEPLEPLDSNDPLLVKMAKETVSIPKKSLEERKRQFISQLKDKALRVERSITPPEEDSAGRRRLRKGTTIGQRSDIHAARVKAEPKLRDFQEGRYEDLLNRFDKRRARKLGIHVPVDIENTLDKKRKRIQKRNKRERDRKHQAKNSK